MDSTIEEKIHNLEKEVSELEKHQRVKELEQKKQQLEENVQKDPIADYEKKLQLLKSDVILSIFFDWVLFLPSISAVVRIIGLMSISDSATPKRLIDRRNNLILSFGLIWIFKICLISVLSPRLYYL